MFGFGAISELPLSTTVADVATTHTGSTTLSATGSVTSVGLQHIRAASILSGTGTVSSVGQVTRLGIGSLSASGTVSSIGQLTRSGDSSLSSSAVLSAVSELSSGKSTLSSLATVSASGALTKLGTATLSASGTTLNVGVVHIAVASLLADVGTLSGTLVGSLNFNAGGLSSSATIDNVPSVDIPATSTISGSGAMSSDGVVEKLGQASLGTGSPFDNGFSDGFNQGTHVSGHGFVATNHLRVIATLTATAEVAKFVEAVTLPSTASLSADLTALERCSLQSIGSLTGNSVLLHGGSTNLSSLATIQARLLSVTEKPDTVSFSLYVDKLRELDGYIIKTKNITGHIDKQLSINSYIDKNSGITGYIDKIVEKTLVRER